MPDNDLDLFTAEYQEEVRAHAGQADEEAEPVDAFTRLVIDDLIEGEILTDGQLCRHKDRGLALNGHYLNDDSLDLFITHYTGNSIPEVLDRRKVGECFKPLTTFVRKVLRKYFAEVKDGTPIFDVSLTIFRARDRLKHIRLFLFTDCRAGVVGAPRETIIEKIPVSYHIWDIQELYRFRSSGRRCEPIKFDFSTATGNPVPCVTLPDHGQEYRSFLAIIPGQVLFQLYEEFGQRLLELNVRSFLQARGRGVNRGIQETIKKDPQNFFAYNNGISATAESIEVVPLPAGGLGIKSVRALQIVNGGQTTASIHHAVRHLKADISQIYVQAKLSEVPPELVELLVPRISEYSNSQNKVGKDDFYANHVFHIEIEKLSRSVLTLPQMENGKPRMTHWFYERARGQFAEGCRAAATNAASRRKFLSDNPANQRFGKTDLAKFVNSWDGYPHWVSLGAQKNFLKFAERLKEKPELFTPDTPFFHRLIALAILYRHTERVVRAADFPAYRANIVTYSLAYLSHWRGQMIDLDRVWREQCVPDLVSRSLEVIAKEVYPVIDRADGGNVTEWCKKPACWEAIRSLRIKLELESDQ